MPDGADTGRVESLDPATTRVDRALLHLGAAGRVQGSIVADAIRQVAACAAALQLVAAAFPLPGELAPPTGTKGRQR
jgi:hypothetical protein